MLIFLNLVAVGGLLLGLVKSANKGFIELYTGAVRVRPLEDKNYIQFPEDVMSFAKSLPGFVSLSPHVQGGAKLEIGYKEKKAGSEVSNVSVSLVGIDPVLERKTTTINDYIIEGRFLEPGDRDKIVLGSIIAGRGATIAIGEALQDVQVGSKIQASYGNGVRREYTVVGIYKTKIAVRNLQAFVTSQELNDVLGYTSPQYSDISIKISDPKKAESFHQYFHNAGYDKDNRIETWEEAQGSAVNDVNKAMTFIGDIVGAIGLMVGSITIFILIFVNAVSRRKYIGILKAIGIRSNSIILAYVFQGLFYTFIGVSLGILLLYFGLIPYFDAHPIDFPFSDATLYVTPEYARDRIIVLLIVAFFSGLLPAYLITRENTLDAILGR